MEVANIYLLYSQLDRVFETDILWYENPIFQFFFFQTYKT